MEDSVASSLNLFDIIVRLVPGTLALLWWSLLPTYGLRPWEDWGDAVSLFAFFVVAYVVGSVLRGLAKPMTMLVHYFAYGGSPRDRYADDPVVGVPWYKPVRGTVLQHDETLRLARACERQIVAEFFGAEAAERAEYHYRFAFSTMLNALEAQGCSGKEDRMLCISDMCSSLATVFFVGAVASWVCGTDAMWVRLAVAVGCVSLFQFLSYERFRYDTIVRTYAIGNKKVREAMREANVAGRDQHEELALELDRVSYLAATLAKRARSVSGAE